MSETVRTEFEGIRQIRRNTTPSTRYEVSPGCFLTLFDDGRTRFTIDPVKSGRRIAHTVTNTSTLPGGKMIETKELID